MAKSGIRFYINFVGSGHKGKVGMGVALDGHRYYQDFPKETPLGDAIGVLRTVILKRASGLEETPPDGDNTPDQGSML